MSYTKIGHNYGMNLTSPTYNFSKIKPKYLSFIEFVFLVFFYNIKSKFTVLYVII